MEALIRVMQQTSVPLTADCLRVCESQLDRHTADATTCVPVKSQLTAQTGASVRGTLERRDTLPTIVYTPCTIVQGSEGVERLLLCTILFMGLPYKVWVVSVNTHRPYQLSPV